MKRIVVCCDGTWNADDTQDRRYERRAYGALDPRVPGGRRHIADRAVPEGGRNDRPEA